MSVKSAFGAGILVGELVAIVMTEIVPRLVISLVTATRPKRWLLR